MTPTGTQSASVIAFRRALFAILNIATWLGLGGWLAAILSADGFGILDAAIVVTFLIGAPWITVGFWNSVIGFVLLHFTRDPISHVCPAAKRARRDDPLFVRTAIFMTVRNEDPARAFARLRVMKESVDATGEGDKFDYFVLSDSSAPEAIAAERVELEKWQAETEENPVYRRRESNTGFKAGNVRDFCERWGAQYDLMIPLDADSVMTGRTILHLVRIVQANPRLGILQSLVVGMPSASFFARVFQFGMRHGMRSFTTGSAWWHADCGPFWGHNAIIRVAPFTAHCRLPDLPGKPPFGGHVLSHDQIEAMMMRNAGYEVRVLPEEEGSFEEMPPALPDFAARDLRWCQGNLQYLKLLDIPKLPTGKVNIALAIQMFVGVASFVLFVILAAVAAVRWPGDVAFPETAAFFLYIVWLAMFFTPKLAGYADAMLRSAQRYGGAARLFVGALVETVFTFLIAPVSMVSQTMFMIATVFGRTTGWNTQRRVRYRLAWSEAARLLWPHTLFGLVLLAFLARGAPGAIVWFLPFIAGLLLAIPFAVVTASPRLAARAEAAKLCAIPEEFDIVSELAAIQKPVRP